MPRARYYTPQLDRELVTSLYHAAKSQGVPMTRLASAFVRDGLARMESFDGTTAIVREDPPATDPGGPQN